MNKGDLTRQVILDHALNLASTGGLNSLTIGTLATQTGMSKSGLFAHFKSKENLQLAILERTTERFQEMVVIPTRSIESPLAKIRQLARNWLKWDQQAFDGSCIFVGAIAEFDDQPGKIQDFLRGQQNRWVSYLAHQFEKAIERGELKPSANHEQLAFKTYSFYLGSHMYHWLGGESNSRLYFWQAFTDLLEQYEVR